MSDRANSVKVTYLVLNEENMFGTGKGQYCDVFVIFAEVGMCIASLF